MSTIQNRIRNYVVSSIVATTGLPEAGAVQGPAVHRAPRRNIPVEALPAICVFSHEDRPLAADADSSRAHDRIYTLAVDISQLGRQEEDITDDLAVKVRKGVLVNPTLGGLVFIATLTQQTWGGVEAEKPIAGTLLLFSFHYAWRPEW